MKSLQSINLKKNNYKIFLFHGVIKKNRYMVRNYTNKHLLENKFLSYLKNIKKNFNILSLKEIIFRIENNQNLPRNSCAITFDDGFENNYSVAAPILDELKIPTTFFFSSDFIENNNMSWIDKIELCFEKKKNFTLKLPWFKKKIDIKNKKTKLKILHSIRANVKNNFLYKENEIVNSIYKQCKQKTVNYSNSDIDKKINWHQVKKMSQHYLFDIGGHSHHHISFGSLTKRKIVYEIDKSFELFKKRLGIILEYYSYPEGQKNDFNQFVINKLRDKKIKFCPTAIDGINNKKTDFFKLRRTML